MLPHLLDQCGSSGGVLCWTVGDLVGNGGAAGCSGCYGGDVTCNYNRKFGKSISEITVFFFFLHYSAAGCGLRENPQT